LDTTRKDYINEKFSPFLYNFSKNSLSFENCRTPVPLTLPAHTSILTGLYPKNHKVRNNSSYRLNDKIKTIQEILKEKGFKTASFVSSFVLNKSYNLSKGFDLYDDELLENYDKKDFEMEERKAEDTAKRAIDFLKKNKNEKIFLWVHFFDPHYPYLNHKEAPDGFSNYEKEIYYMDIYLKKVVEEFLKERDGLIVIVGDHGEALGEHGEETHGVFLYDCVLRVPLIIKNTKENTGKKIFENVSLIDIFPTILDFLKIKIPENVDGISLFKKIEKRNFYFESFLPSESFGWATPFSIFDGKYKFIFLPKKEIYDLEKDPKEEKNLFDKERKKAKDLFDLLQKEYTIKYEPREKLNLSIEDSKKLESLGYFSGSKPSEKDPKDLIWVVKALEEGKKFAEEKNYEKAKEIFSKILKENPENYPALIQYGTVLREENDLDGALEIFKKARALNPTFIHSRFNLATIYFEKNNLKDAEDEFLKIIDLLPSFSESYFYLVRIYLQKNDIKRAKDIIEKAKENVKKDANLYFFEGLICARNSEFEKAIYLFENSLKYNPNYFDAKFNLAQSYYKFGKKELALKNFEEALNLNQNFPQIYLIIASIYLYDFENIEKAKEYFNLFLQKFPSHPEAKNVREILNSF